MRVSRPTMILVVRRTGMAGMAGAPVPGRRRRRTCRLPTTRPATWPAEQGPCAGEAPADQEPCEASPNIFQQFCCFGKGPICTTYAEAIALQRSNTRNQPLFLDRGGADRRC